MKTAIACVIGILCFGISASQERIIGPPDPVEDAKFERANQLIEQARQLLLVDKIQEGIAKLEEAASVEATIKARPASSAKLYLAKLYVKLKRPEDALQAYRGAFLWDEDGLPEKLKLDWAGNLKEVMDYAILLAKSGREEDAKAMYYYGLLNFNQASRHSEPAPFLVVFDPEPEGVQWEYTPERLEAAALMIQELFGGTHDWITRQVTPAGEVIDRIRKLTPDWFYPVAVLADWQNMMQNKETWAKYIAEAEALAKPGIEKEILATYRMERNELLEKMKKAGVPYLYDNSPMTEGAKRRARMKCLKPNEEVLRRLSTPRPPSGYDQ